MSIAKEDDPAFILSPAEISGMLGHILESAKMHGMYYTADCVQDAIEIAEEESSKITPSFVGDNDNQIRTLH